MSEAGDVVMLGWCDLAGLVRVRAVPKDKLSGSLEFGVGWPAAGAAILPTGGIADNPWGPMMEVRQVPVDAGVSLPATATSPAFDLVLTRSTTQDGQPWDCCPRTFCDNALQALKKETGWSLVSAFEFEFSQTGNPELAKRPVYSLDAFRAAAPFVSDVMAALRASDLLPATIEPEFGAGQLETSISPSEGIAGADRAILAREIIREVARRKAWPVTFSPKPAPEAVGNGQHVHFSFLDAEGEPALYAPSEPGMINSKAASFVGGIMRHMSALCAIAAPAPVSYLRLGPNHWSCGYASFGVQNREVAIRVCPPTGSDEAKRAKTINLEFRPPDSLSNPYLLIGMLIHAGLEGIRDKLPLPPMLEENPADLDEEKREQFEVKPLPATLGEALDALEADETARGWMPSTLYNAYVSLKRAEIDHFATLDAEQTCQIMADIY